MLSATEVLRFNQIGLSIETADTPAAIRAAQSLRHQVFCRERTLFAAEPGQTTEADEFDARSRHVLIREHAQGEVVGTARVVVGCAERRASCLPMQRYCSPSLFRHVQMDTLGEISRFAISKQFRRDAGPLIRLGLLHGILRVSRELGLTHWCALMEPSLIRLLGATGVHFAPLGDMVDAYGQRQPSIAAIDLTVASGRRQRPDYYRLVSRGLPDPERGVVCSGSAVFASAAPPAGEAEQAECGRQHRERRRLRG